MGDQSLGRVVYLDKRLDPREGAPSKQAAPATLGTRGTFAGFRSLFRRYGMLKTGQARAIGTQGIAGNCSGTLRDQMQGLQWKVLTTDGKETDETDYYTLLMENARDENGAIIGASGLFDVLAQDVLMAHEGGACEVVRLDKGPNAGVPIALYAMDGGTLRWAPRSADDEEPIAQVEGEVGSELARFRQDEVMHIVWNRYAERGLHWYNRHPVQVAWVALNCLAASDDYSYSLLTEVVPQGLLDLGKGFDAEKAAQWRDAWRAARQSGKLEDIGLLWGTEGAQFIRFQEPMKDQPFQTMNYWYLTIVAGAFGLTPLDIGFMTQINTKAGSETVAEQSRHKGLAHLLQVVKQAVGFWILPTGLELVWPDLDPSDERVEAETREANARAITAAYAGGMGWLKREQAQAEAVRLGVFEIGAVQPEPEGGEQEPGSETEDRPIETEDVAATLAKSHTAQVVVSRCPLEGCDGTDAFSYEGHGHWLVCRACGRAYNPLVYGGGFDRG